MFRATQHDNSVEHISLLVFLGILSSGQTPARPLAPFNYSMDSNSIHQFSSEKRQGSDHEIAMILETRMPVPTHSSEETLFPPLYSSLFTFAFSLTPPTL